MDDDKMCIKYYTEVILLEFVLFDRYFIKAVYKLTDDFAFVESNADDCVSQSGQNYIQKQTSLKCFQKCFKF